MVVEWYFVKFIQYLGLGIIILGFGDILKNKRERVFYYLGFICKNFLRVERNKGKKLEIGVVLI